MATNDGKGYMDALLREIHETKELSSASQVFANFNAKNEGEYKRADLST
jgi:hypothetical protein